MLWTPLATVLIALSCVSTALIVVKLRRGWDLQVSSVRWLFFMLFVYTFVLTVLRFVYYLWIWIALASTNDVANLEVDDGVEYKPLARDQLDRLGIHAILHLRVARNGWMTAIVCMGDVAHLGVTSWLFPLTYELSKIATNSMDRGVVKEQARIRMYKLVVHVVLALVSALYTVLAIIGGGYTTYTHICLLAIYGVQIVLVGYMFYVLMALKWQGRKYERIHSAQVASPVYVRLKQILLVYFVFALQFHIASLLLQTLPSAKRPTPEGVIGLSLVLYNARGLVLSIVTGCSQACILDACNPCLPDDFEAQLMNMQHRMPPSTNEPPKQNPVFVYTDIESSSALWGIGNGLIMQRAIDLHDMILRSLLTKYHGYEITTSGDSFQLAFHSINDAVDYCLEVQMQLLVTEWPKELHDIVPATRRQQRGKFTKRMVFNGLRVRMGIHDASGVDGPLVCRIHAVTGKMTYVGAAEVITREVGDLGAGGQIVITDRVAQWLVRNEALMAHEYSIDRLCTYVSASLTARPLELYELYPVELRDRKELITRPADNLYRPASQMAYLRHSATDDEFGTLDSVISIQ